MCSDISLDRVEDIVADAETNVIENTMLAVVDIDDCVFVSQMVPAFKRTFINRFI